MLLQEINLKDNGYSKGIQSAQKALSELAKENGVANVSFRNTNKEVNAAKRYYSTLTAEYSKLSDEAKKSEFGRAMHQQLQQTEKDLESMMEATERAKAKIEELQDQAKKKVKFGESTGSLFGDIKKSFSKMDKNKLVGDLLGKAGFGEAAGAIETLGGAMGGGMAAGAAGAAAGIAAVGIAVKETVDVTKEAIQKSAEFGQAMSQLGAITGVSGKALESMRAQVMSVGDDTHTAYTEVAQNFALVGSALPELLKDSQGMEEVSRSAIMLSKAGRMELSDATNALTATMAQFDVSASESAHVVDILANGGQLGTAGIGELADTLQRAGTAANSAGVQLNEAAALTEVLAEKGIKGAEAGTALRNVLLNMSTKGIDEINPKVVGLQTALENLQKHADDAQWMVKVFGMEGATAATNLAEGLPTYEKLIAQIDNVGTAAKMAEQNGANLVAAYQRLQTDWNNFLSSFNVDGANSPLMIAAQQIHNIMYALTGLVEQFKESESVQSVIDVFGQVFDALGQSIATVINIVSDLISVIFKFLDAIDIAEIAGGALAGTFDLLEGVIWFVELAIWSISKAIEYCIGVFNDFKNDLIKGISRIPVLDGLKNALKSIIGWLKETIKLWSQFRAKVTEEMGDYRHPKKDEKSQSGNKGNKNTGNKNKSKNQKAQPKGIIEKLQGELQTLKEKRDKATTKAEIDRLNKQIAAKQKQLNSYNGTSTTSTRTTSRHGGSRSNSTTNTRTEQTPKEKYDSEIALIEEKLKLELINEKKAVEDKIKAIDTYINELGKTKESLKNNKTQIHKLSQQQKLYKNRLKELTEQEDNSKTIKEANNEYRDTINKINRDRINGWATEEETNNQYIQAIETLIKKYKEVGDMSDGMINTINRKQKEVDDIKFAQKLKDFRITYANALEEIDDIINDQNPANEYYKEKRNAYSKVLVKEDEYAMKLEASSEWKKIEGFQEKLKWIQDNSEIMLELGTSMNDIKVLNNIKSYAEADIDELDILYDAIENLDKKLSEGTKGYEFLGIKNSRQQLDWIHQNAKLVKDTGLFNQKDFSSLMKIKDLNKANEEETQLFNDAVIKLRANLSKPWKTEWLAEYKELLKENQNLLGDFSSGIKNVEDIDKLMKLRQYAEAFAPGSPLPIRRYIAGNERDDLELGIEFKYDKSQLDKLQQILDNANIKLETEIAIENLDDITEELESVKLSVDKETFDKLINQIKLISDSIDEDVKNIGQSLSKYQNLWDNMNESFMSGSKGDKSNYSLSTTPSADIEKKFKKFYQPKQTFFWQDTNKTDNMQDELDKLIEKYKEVEKIAQEAVANNEKLITPYDTSEFEAPLEYLEAEIAKKHAEIQSRLTFEVTMNGIEDTLSGFESFANYTNSLVTFGDQWKQIGENANDAAEVLQKAILIIQTVEGAIQAVNTVMTIANAIESIFQAKKVASTAASEAEAIAEGQNMASKTASIAPTTAAATANKALEATYLDLAAAEIFAAHAAIPFAGVGLAAGFTEAMLGTMASVQAQTLALATFANGGIVGGDAFHGDSTLVRANKGEMLLNNLEQRNLFSLLDGALNSPFGGGRVDFKISGDALYGTLKNYGKIKSKTGHNITL